LIIATLDAPETLGVVMVAAAIAGTLAAVASGHGIALPVVVVELIAGVLIGPHVGGLHTDYILKFFADLGLGLLFFLAGYEIDPEAIRGNPFRLALFGWLASLAIAYILGAALENAGVVVSLIFTGSALATTALGMLVPVLSDTDDLRTAFGTHVLAIGAVGEFGPLMLVSLVLARDGTLHNAELLGVFAVCAVFGGIAFGLLARRSRGILERTVEQSSQLAIRWLLVLAFAITLLASELGLDLVIGGFIGGLITRQVVGGELPPIVQSKLNAVSYGIFVPFFFVVSGMRLDVSVFSTPEGILKMLFFFALFFIVRGGPVLVIYRRVFGTRDRFALALMGATQLTMVIAITTLARETGHMRASTQAALVGGAALTALIFPTLALRLRARVAAVPAVEGA